MEDAAWTLGTQVRCVHVTTTKSSAHDGPTAMATVGDAEGYLHLFSWPVFGGGNCDGSADTSLATSFTHACIPLTSDAILQVAWDESATHMAISTLTGAVFVYRIVPPRGNAGTTTTTTIATTDIVWSTQRAGPVRALTWQGNILVFGGYDMCCVLVDTTVWGVVREIVLEGTVRR